MKLKFIYIFFHTLLLVSSAGNVKEDSVYRNSEQTLGKQKSLRFDLLNGESHSTSEDLSKLQHTVSLLEGSIGQINEQLTQNSNRYKELSEAFQEQQELPRTISDSITGFRGEFSNVGTRLTQLENMTATGIPESTTLNASAIQCGGRLLGESGVISYKEYEMYNNGENCTWIIEGPEALKIGLKLEESGLQYCCDHINVISLDTTGLVQKAPVKLGIYNHTVFVDGPKAMVRFTSDSSRTGLGFRVSYYKIPESHCGGRLQGESGVISYKEHEWYKHEESCTWIIEVPEALKIGFKLEKTGLERCCDHVNVSSLNSSGLVQQAPVKLKPSRTVLVDGPKAMVRFSSDESVAGLGFRLIYYKVTNLSSPIEETINESECGGVIVGETGEIRYKLDDIYLKNERCVWLVHSPNSTSITFHLRQTGIQDSDDFVSVTTIDPEAGTLRNDTRLLKARGETVTIQESIAAIVFSSDYYGSNTGFYLTFAGSGFNNNSKYVYKLRHIAEHNATIEYSASDRTMQQHIYVTATSSKGDGKWSRRFISGIDLNAGVFLRANDSSCVYESLTFYEPRPPAKIKHGDKNYNWQKKAQIPIENDTLLCPKKVSVLKQMALLEFDVRSFLAIYKPIRKDMFQSNGAVSFDYYYKPYECVEIVQPLEDEFGIISYKENKNYNNDENCSWIIEVTNGTGIDFNLEQSGFEECCDYLTVTSLDMAGQTQGPTLRLRAGSPTASVTGSRALVSFVSDRTAVGSGFRLRYEGGIFLGDNACHEVLNPMLDDFGVIRYKANEEFKTGEHCAWRIETPGWERIGFVLEHIGFESVYDYLTVGSITANGIEIGRPDHLHADNRNVSLTGPIALVRFDTDGSERRTGFRLVYQKLPALGNQDAQRDDIDFEI